MSVLAANPTTEHAPARVAGARLRFASPIAAHGVVDFFSFLVLPLLTVIEGKFGLSMAQGALLLTIGSISSGTVQPFIAHLSDKHDTRRLGTIGFLVAVLAISSIGWVTEYWHLVVLQALGTAGIGAFHPVAAAAVGHLAGKRGKRSLGVALFFAAGMVGGMAGTWLAPSWVGLFSTDTFTPGLRSLTWFLPMGLLSVGALAWAVHDAPHRHEDAHANHLALSDQERRARAWAMACLYLGAVVRFTVEMAMITLIVRWTERIVSSEALTEATRQQAALLNGPLQAAKQVGMGIAGLSIGYFFRVRHERALLIWFPVIGAAALAVLPHAHGVGAWLVAAAAGVGIGGVQPLSISLAQRILPHRTSLASGLMMGGAWALAAAGPQIAQWLLKSVGMEAAFAIIGGALLLASLSAVFIPARLIHATAER